MDIMNLKPGTLGPPSPVSLRPAGEESGEVSLQLQRLKERIDSLEVRVSKLHEVLEPILGKDTSLSETIRPDAIDLCELAQMIWRLTNRIQYSDEKLELLIDRIEL